MNLTNQVIKNIVTRLIKGQDYRIEVVNLINAQFLQYAIDFFRKVVEAKLNDQDITIDWYRREFGNPQKFKPQEVAIHYGLNKKTITNMHRKAPKQVVIDASTEHFESLCELIESLTKKQNEVDITLTIKFRGVSADFTMSESLIVINTLAVKRAALRGGLWARVGKRTEKVLMKTLFKLYSVPESNYAEKETIITVETKAKKGSTKTTKVKREIDYYFLSNGNQYRCEVKLMGAGNSESVDDVIARNSDVFIADTLSNQNIEQLNDLGIEWVELRVENGYKRFAKVLENLNIPYIDFDGDLDKELDEILKEILVLT